MKTFVDNRMEFLYVETKLTDDPTYIIDRILCEYYDSWELSDILIQSLLVSLFVELERFYYRDENKKKAKSSIDVFLAYIKRNYREGNLEKMAEEFSYHPNHLTALLKQETGKTYLELIHIQRIKIANVLLETSNLSIEEVSLEIGYSSSSFFYKKYKELNGMTPLQFRKSLK